MVYSEDDYRSMLITFRKTELHELLEKFHCYTNGQKSELIDRALGLLRNKPVGLNYRAYLDTIFEIYRSRQIDTSNNNAVQNMMQNQGQQIMLPPLFPTFPPQSILIPRDKLPRVLSQITKEINGNSISGSNNQCYYQPDGSSINVPQFPMYQQVNAVATSHLTHEIHNANSFTPSTQSQSNIKLKKLPFYEVIAEILKPSTLVGHERCSMANLPKGSREAAFIFTLLPEHATYITMHRDISNGKNEYVFQIQIRICLLEPYAAELTDHLPLGLLIRLNNKFCPLPSAASKTLPRYKDRQIEKYIDCTELVKLSPSIANNITINWIPDPKNYVIGIFLVKKLTSENLLEKLKSKELKSSEETKNYIIKKMANVDADLATTSYRFSLVCPLGKTRMKIPTKSSKCDHLQCFDASTFILMNEKKSTWICPTCNQPCLYDDLQIESYFLEVVLNPNLPDFCKEIEILADGTWKINQENYEPLDITVDDNNEKRMGSVSLNDYNDENPKKYHILETCIEPETLTTCIIDLTLSDDEEPPIEKDLQENEALVTPQQDVTYSEQGAVIEIDCSSPPPLLSPILSTTTS